MPCHSNKHCIHNIIAPDISIYDGVEQSKYAHVTGMTIMRYDLST